MQSSSTTTVDQPVAKHLAPIIIESYGRAYRVHAPDLHLDSAKFCLVIEGMGAGSRYWTKVAYATSAIPDVLAYHRREDQGQRLLRNPAYVVRTIHAHPKHRGGPMA
jgi:hypothetical protein